MKNGLIDYNYFMVVGGMIDKFLYVCYLPIFREESEIQCTRLLKINRKIQPLTTPFPILLTISSNESECLERIINDILFIRYHQGGEWFDISIMIG